MKSINRGFAESQVRLLKDGVINVFTLIENFRLEGAVKCLLAQMVFAHKTALLEDSFFNVQPSTRDLRCCETWGKNGVISPPLSLELYSSLHRAVLLLKPQRKVRDHGPAEGASDTRHL